MMLIERQLAFRSIGLAAVLFLAVGMGVLAGRLELLAPILGFAALAGGVAGYALLARPQFGWVALLGAAYLIAGASRYIEAPVGLAVDGILVLTLAGVLWKHWGRREWGFLLKPSGLAVGIWTALSLAQVVNPNAVSREAWFYAVRGVALYWALAYPIMYLLLRPAEAGDARASQATWTTIRRVLFGALILSGLGALWGMRQNVVGLDPWEQAWLSIPGNLSTHMLNGKLRTFSFFSDTGQFGINMAYGAMMSVILALGPRRLHVRIGLLILSVLLFVGLAQSGTRSAFIGFLAGFPVFLFLRRNITLLVIGFALLGAGYGVLKFTYAGQSIYAVQRMRQAVDPLNDPSFLVRLENQKRLANYLDSHPIGGGIGSAGNWGKRFSPGTFLANLALDSWYVKIAAEQGYVGLAIYLVVVIVCGVRGLQAAWLVRDAERRNLLEALVSMYWAVALASYSNQYLGQIPTGILMIFAIVVFEVAIADARDAAAAEPASAEGCAGADSPGLPVEPEAPTAAVSR